MMTHTSSTATTPRSIAIGTAKGTDDLRAICSLFSEYAQSLGVDLSFQRFDEELAQLPGDYAAPTGELLLARVDGEAAGCVALRPSASAAHHNACEMKRLYIRPAFRGLKLGGLLTGRILDAARSACYASMLLDTLETMTAARAIYDKLGFVDIPAYYHNPLEGVRYLKLSL